MRSSPTAAAASSAWVDLVLAEGRQEPRVDGVRGPHPREAVGLELRAHGGALRTLPVATDPVERAEQVLHVMPVLVRQDVRLRERTALGPEPSLQLLEEPEVDVDLLVRGAVEGAHVRGRRPATGAGGSGEEHGHGGAVSLDRAGPIGLDAVHGADQAAVAALLGVLAGLALVDAPRPAAADRPTITPSSDCERARDRCSRRPSRVISRTTMTPTTPAPPPTAMPRPPRMPRRSSTCVGSSFAPLRKSMGGGVPKTRSAGNRPHGTAALAGSEDADLPVTPTRGRIDLFREAEQLPGRITRVGSPSEATPAEIGGFTRCSQHRSSTTGPRRSRKRCSSSRSTARTPRSSPVARA